MGTCPALTPIIIVLVCHVVGCDQVASGGDLDGHLRFRCHDLLPQAEDDGLFGFLVLFSCRPPGGRWRLGSVAAGVGDRLAAVVALATERSRPSFRWKRLPSTLYGL